MLLGGSRNVSDESGKTAPERAGGGAGAGGARRVVSGLETALDCLDVMDKGEEAYRETYYEH